VDDRVPQDSPAVAAAITLGYTSGGHAASLATRLSRGRAIGQHGSWNRSKLSGYKLVFVAFENGRPTGGPHDILSGFLAPNEKVSYGRPMGVTLGSDGRSLLRVDDVGNVNWRVTSERSG